MSLSVPDENRNNMKLVRRTSVIEDFETTSDAPIPEVCSEGARVRVHYAGACYTDCQMQHSGRRGCRVSGIHDNSLFPGYEVSGVIHELGNEAVRDKLKVGDRVILYPEDEDMNEEGYAEYICVKDAHNLVRIPDSMSMQVAAMLPTGGLTAYNALLRIKPFIDHKIKSQTASTASLLIVGAGGLGMWTLSLARHILCDENDNRMTIALADPSVDKLTVAERYGCHNLIHWQDSLHEEYLIDRTKSVCKGGVDVIIDYCSSPRTVQRSLNVLKHEGMLVVGGNSRYEVSVRLYTLAKNGQCIMGVSKGSRDQLEELVELVASGKVVPPGFSIFPLDQANDVFEQLSHCKMTKRPVFQVSVDESEESVPGESVVESSE